MRFREALKARAGAADGGAVAGADGDCGGDGGRRSGWWPRRWRAADAGYRFEAAAAGGDDGVLAEPLQRVCAEEPEGALLLPAYEREAVLPNALGKFEDLLVATAKSPAMLMYLDNWESIGPDSLAAGRVAAVQAARSEREDGAEAAEGDQRELCARADGAAYAGRGRRVYAAGCDRGREVLYGMDDRAAVWRAAGCGLGWAAERDAGEFVFDPNRHEPGTKMVLGHVIPEGGMNEGLEVLHILATSPATAHFISKKLAVRFVSDTPPPALVDRMAAAFLKRVGISRRC